MRKKNALSLHMSKSKLSYKIFSFLLLIVILFSALVFYFSFGNARELAEIAKDNAKFVADISTQEITDALNTQAKTYLQEIAQETVGSIGNYLIRVKEDIIFLTKIDKTSELFLSFFSLQTIETHRRNDTAPMAGISFPFEEDATDVEQIPVFRSLRYIGENGMEKIKIENNEIVSELENVADTSFFKETKDLKEGEFYVFKKKYTIWDCTERNATLIGETLFKNEGDCPHTGIMALNATNWTRFSDGYIRYATPIYEDSIFMGILVADVDFLPIMKIVNDVEVRESGYTYLQQSIIGTDEYERGEGITLAHPSHQFVLNMDPASLYQLGAPGLDDLRNLSQKQHKGEYGIGRYLFRDVDKYTAYAAYNESGIIWSVGITSPVEEFTGPAQIVGEKIDEAMIETNEEMEQTTENSIKFFSVMIVVSIFLLLGSLILVVNKMVVFPLRKLRDAAEEISKGNLNANIEIKSKDEIGSLASAFGHMTEELKKYHKNLETRVEERTKELNTKIDELERYKKATVDRELKMVELKNKIEGLKTTLSKVK